MKQHFLIYIILILFSSCFPPQKATIDEDIITLANTKWQLIKPNKLEATLSFNEDSSEVSGYNGCNQYSSELTKKNYQIEFGIFTTTERYCEEKNEIEQTFMKTLARVNDYSLSGSNKLYLKQGNSILLTFKEIEE